MTEVSKMTDQQLNRALAELVGWKNIHEDPYGHLWGQPADDRWSNSLPEYCTDPAASLEVQTAAIAKNPVGYVDLLHRIAIRRAVMWRTELIDVAYILNATPRQRAEAAYMTLKGE